MDKDIKAKNGVIIFLVIVCAILSVMLLNTKQTTSSISATKAPTALAQKDGTLDPISLIKIAEIDGISLGTAPDKITDILKKNGYKCEHKDTLFTCAHDTLDNTKITIKTRDNQVIKINRNGIILPESIAANLTYLDELRSKLNTRKEVSFNQSDNRTVFIVKERNDGGFFRLSYNIKITNRRDKDNKTHKVFIYNASISR